MLGFWRWDFDAGSRLGGVDEKSPPLSSTSGVELRIMISRYAKFLWATSRGWENSNQSMRTVDQGQIGPLLRGGYFCRERFARIFLSCPTPVLSGRISLQPIAKLPSFLLKYFAVVLNYLPNEWILRGEAPGYWLRPVLSTRGEQLIPADDRKEETTLPYSFSP